MNWHHYEMPQCLPHPCQCKYVDLDLVALKMQSVWSKSFLIFFSKANIYMGWKQVTFVNPNANEDGKFRYHPHHSRHPCMFACWKSRPMNCAILSAGPVSIPHSLHTCPVPYPRVSSDKCITTMGRFSQVTFSTWGGC